MTILETNVKRVFKIYLISKLFITKYYFFLILTYTKIKMYNSIDWIQTAIICFVYKCPLVELFTVKPDRKSPHLISPQQRPGREGARVPSLHLTSSHPPTSHPRKFTIEPLIFAPTAETHQSKAERVGSSILWSAPPSKHLTCSCTSSPHTAPPEGGRRGGGGGNPPGTWPGFPKWCHRVGGVEGGGVGAGGGGGGCSIARIPYMVPRPFTLHPGNPSHASCIPRYYTASLTSAVHHLPRYCIT